MSFRLHIDVSRGARADALAAALHGLGAPLQAAELALDAIGCAAALEAVHALHHGLWAHSLRVAPSAVPSGTAQPPRRRRARGVAGLTAAALGRHCSIAELRGVLAAAALEPVVGALADKALRRAQEALRRVSGEGALLEREPATKLLSDVVMVSALLHALSPGVITAPPVFVARGAEGLEGVVGAAAWPTPSPWLLEVLAGVPTHEDDAGGVGSDVASASLLWASVQRFGPRGLSTSTEQALGLSADNAHGKALVRMLRGPLPPIRTRKSDSARCSLLSMEATLAQDADVEGVVKALAQEGAVDAVVNEVADFHGRASSVQRRARVSMLISTEAFERARAILWQAGAIDVRSAWSELDTAGVVEMTVPLGTGKQGRTVRVRAVRDGGLTLRAEPVGEDVRAAASSQGTSTHEVAAEAMKRAMQLLAKQAGGKHGENKTRKQRGGARAKTR